MIIFVFRGWVLWISFVNMNNFLLFCVLLLILRMYINFEWLVYLHGTRINCLLQFIYYLGPFSFLRMLLCFVHLYIVYFLMSFRQCFFDFIVMSGELLQMCSENGAGPERDELDFEFLGNKTGEPYLIQTNVYKNGTRGRKMRHMLWFDPTEDYHTYSIQQELEWDHVKEAFA